MAEEGKAKAVAFDEIDKAPEEKKRGITIATVSCFCDSYKLSSSYHFRWGWLYNYTWLDDYVNL